MSEGGDATFSEMDLFGGAVEDEDNEQQKAEGGENNDLNSTQIPDENIVENDDDGEKELSTEPLAEEDEETAQKKSVMEELFGADDDEEDESSIKAEGKSSDDWQKLEGDDDDNNDNAEVVETDTKIKKEKKVKGEKKEGGEGEDDDQDTDEQSSEQKDSNKQQKKSRRFQFKSFYGEEEGDYEGEKYNPIYWGSSGKKWFDLFHDEAKKEKWNSESLINNFQKSLEGKAKEWWNHYQLEAGQEEGKGLNFPDIAVHFLERFGGLSYYSIDRSSLSHRPPSGRTLSLVHLPNIVGINTEEYSPSTYQTESVLDKAVQEAMRQSSIEQEKLKKLQKNISWKVNNKQKKFNDNGELMEEGLDEGIEGNNSDQEEGKIGGEGIGSIDSGGGGKGGGGGEVKLKGLMANMVRLRADNIIRWRWTTDENGNKKKESNARMIRWDDGSISLKVGNEYFDIVQSIPSNQSSWLFSSPHILNNNNNSNTNEILNTNIGIFSRSMKFKVTSLQSKSHQKMRQALSKFSSGKAAIMEAPLVDKQTAIQLKKEEEEREKQAKKRESKVEKSIKRAERAGMSADFLEGGDDDNDMNNNNNNRSRKRTIVDDDDERRRMKKIRSAKETKYEDDEEEDEEDYEESEEGGDSEGEGGSDEGEEGGDDTMAVDDEEELQLNKSKAKRKRLTDAGSDDE